MTSLSEIADAVRSIGVHTVYGEAQDIEGTTVVPVALVGFGFGGGSDEGNGGGGGGGGFAIPVGAYVGDSLGVRFQPSVIAVLAVGIPFVWVSGKALARVVKALKK